MAGYRAHSTAATIHPTQQATGGRHHATLFVIDRSAATPSPLARRLCAAGYHTLSFADAGTLLATMRCVLPNLILVDLSAVSREDAAGFLTLLAGTHGACEPGSAPRAGARAASAIPVMLLSASADDGHVLGPQLALGELVPVAESVPNKVLRRIRDYVRPNWPAMTTFPAAADRPRGATSYVAPYREPPADVLYLPIRSTGHARQPSAD
jgi:hypothetical protein